MELRRFAIRQGGLATGAMIGLAALVSSAFGEPSSGPHAASIDKNGTLILIRSSLLALQQANETGNYTVLRDLGAPGFQQSNNAARLGEIFSNLRGQKLDLAGVTVLDPQLTILPQIESNGLMHMAGFFPSVPSQINFELLYAPVNGRWRLFGISVNVGSSAPAAPDTPKASNSVPKLAKTGSPRPRRSRQARPIEEVKTPRKEEGGGR